ncbi:MAG: ABC transporter permease [Planctomycetes bacterium]|nr:ABC transporter permease [Planctomycetota bacterium]
MLGVVFGVASVIAMLAVGEGASRDALAQIRKLGSNNLLISSIKPPDDLNVGGSGRVRMLVYGLSYQDEGRIRETLPAVARAVPAKTVRKEGRLGERMIELRVVGTTPDWFDLVPRPILAGRVMTPLDRERQSSVAVLTEFGARKLLAAANTIGQVLKLGTQYFEVIGIVQSEGGSGSGIQTPDQDVDAYIPLEVARDRFGDVTQKISAGSREREMVELHQLIVEAKTLDDVEPLAAALEAMLARFHPKKDTRISVPLALLRQAEATKRTFNVVLGSIAGISLLVGGIGIMNIMLASVTERTREIGVRRAIGAKRRQIVAQFLIETVVLSCSGGVLGVAVGAAIPAVITYAAGMPTVVTPWSIALAFGISAGVGVVFGLYPAARAAWLDPIEALRHA